MGASIGCYIVHFTNPVFTFYFLVNFRSLSYPGTCLHGLIQILSKGEFPYLNITPFVLCSVHTSSCVYVVACKICIYKSLGIFVIEAAQNPFKKHWIGLTKLYA